MKFLIHANAPWVRTGYGVQAAMLAEALKADGHEVAISSTYGQQGGVGMWRGITVYPCGYEVNSNDILHNHAAHFFGGDPKDGWIIPIIDMWCLVNPLLADFNILAWTPVDHFPVPQDVIKFFHRTEAVPVAMSEFGQRELLNAGLDAHHIPLGLDLSVYKPTFEVESSVGPVPCRALFGLPDDAYVVGMVAMNKGWARDRKGFNEAFRAFGKFWKDHQEAVLFLHTEKFGGADGFNLAELLAHAAVPEHAVVWVDQYAYRMGLSPEHMAAAYTAMDVLLAPSHGEGFCVPLIEAQACGTPVIATDFSAQSELVHVGTKVFGQPEWDPAQHASYICPYIFDVVQKLEEMYVAPRGKVAQATEWAHAHFDFAKLYAERWRPLIERLAAPTDPLPLDREPIPDTAGVAVLVPVLNRPENVQPLVESFRKATPKGAARLYFVYDEDDDAERVAVQAYAGSDAMIPALRGPSFAKKLNTGLAQTVEPWLFVCGDDVRFHDGWLDEARKLSDRYDVIGTNDSATDIAKNPDVAAGRHADHFFVRRAYVDTYGACLDGPGVLAPEVYGHWYTDKEVVELAKARGVFSPCLTSIVEHLHPGYDGNEDARYADPTYMKATETRDDDARQFRTRMPLIAMQRTSLAKTL